MKIICLGDSFTAGYGVAQQECWVSLLNASSGHTWINAGISGDTSPGMLSRLQTQVLPEKPDLVIWLGGYNDILLTGSSHLAKSCVMAFVNQCASAGVRPVIGIPFPISGVARPWNRLCSLEACLPILEEYVLWLRQLAGAALLRSVDFSGAGAHLMADGMHPTPQGHRLMAQAVAASGHFREV